MWYKYDNFNKALKNLGGVGEEVAELASTKRGGGREKEDVCEYKIFTLKEPSNVGCALVFLFIPSFTDIIVI